MAALLFLFLVFPPVSGQFPDERTALFHFKKSISDPTRILTTWNAANFNHCSWYGVSCNSNLRVSGIKIEGNFSPTPCSELSLHDSGVISPCPNSSRFNRTLRGKLPSVITKFKEIRVLSFPFNEFVGEIPVEIWGLCGLQVLDLRGNGFHGDFSGFNFSCLRHLRVLNLGFNRIFGKFPDSLSKCRGLRVLNIAGNGVHGLIPGYVFRFLRLQVVNLSHNRLVGFVPIWGFGYGCEKLKHLDLSGNFLVGRIPRALGSCSRLRTLLLCSNLFHGIIPFELGNLQSLEVFDVSRNVLNGPLPDSLGNCSNLSVLVLRSSDIDEYNSFDGCIPYRIAKLPKLRIIWAPGASLQGDFPAKWGSCKSLTMVHSALNFLELRSNRLIGRLHTQSGAVPNSEINVYSRVHSVRKKLLMDPRSDHNSKGGIHHRLTILAIASIVCTSVIVALFLAFLASVCYAKRRNLDSRIDVSSSPFTERVTVFNDVRVPLTHEIIIAATENFSQRNCIGCGGFGSTYRAELAPGTTIAVKRLTAAERHHHFYAEIATLGRIRHPNLITLIGYYANGAEMFLIYNYLPGGNLDRFIREREKRAFDFHTLHKIASRVASALVFLHDECDPCILHRDIKPSNILLDNDNNAYLSDFGLSKILTTAGANICCIAGTYGYIAPEYASTGRVSDKADVYSYGVVLLELLSDKRALDPSFHSHEDGFNIVSWACLLRDQGRVEDVFAACVRSSGSKDSLVRMLDVAVMCTVELVEARPTMKEVVDKLLEIGSSS